MSGKTRIGMVTVGQAPRADIVPDMAALLPDVDILEAGALDGLDRAAIARLAPEGRRRSSSASRTCCRA